MASKCVDKSLAVRDPAYTPDDVVSEGHQMINKMLNKMINKMTNNMINKMITISQRQQPKV